MRSVLVPAALTIVLWNPVAPPAASAPPSPGRPALSCESGSIKAPPNVTITSVKSVEAPVRHCRVDGYTTTTNPGPNTVGFAVALPEAWNGRYLMVIPGGSASTVPPPPTSYIQAGYAVATTDRGTHVKHGLDFSFQTDPARLADFTYRAAHVSAMASQSLAAAYYARGQNYRYITGCSTGGAATLMSAQRFPQDAEAFLPFAVDADGGAPSYWGYIAQTLSRDPQRWISEAEMKRVNDTIMQRFDATDGALDGLIWDPTKIVLSPQLFPYLSAKQFATLKLLGDGFPNAEGKAQGYWLSNPTPLVKTFLGAGAPPWTATTRPTHFMVSDTMARAKHGADYNILTDMDFTKPQPQPEEQLGPAHLDPIQRTGGKILMYIGAADHNISPQNHVDFTEALTRRYGAKSTSWFRNYFIPGMHHCGGGEGQPTDVTESMLRAAQQWVEQGKAPDYVIASNPELRRTYRICSYPQVAHFKGGVRNPAKLDFKDANNWTCSGKMGRG